MRIKFHKENEFLINDDYAIMVIQSKTFGEFKTLIDIEDIEKIKGYCWGIRYDKRHPKHYVETHINNKRVHLHRFLLDLNETFTRERTVDHINGDSLDNRKSNLRICTQKENAQNMKTQRKSKSGVKYIIWSKHFQRWQVIYKTKYYGQFLNLSDAKKRLEQIQNCKVA